MAHTLAKNQRVQKTDRWWMNMTSLLTQSVNIHHQLTGRCVLAGDLPSGCLVALM